MTCNASLQLAYILSMLEQAWYNALSESLVDGVKWKAVKVTTQTVSLSLNATKQRQLSASQEEKSRPESWVLSHVLPVQCFW